MTDPVLALVGPTASGKSSLALEIAEGRGDTEIVAVDAFTIYRGMDVGTAKPSAADREVVAHHMIDVADPTHEISVAEFQRAARHAIARITDRDRVPLLVGGSGLYFRAVVDDLVFPPTDPTVRAELEERYRDEPAAAHRELTELDPRAAEKIEPENLRRSVRALEVIRLTGKRFSAFARAWEDFRSIYEGLEVAYLEPPSDVLRRRIEERARAMVDRGLVDEARALRERHGELSRTAEQAIGYQEAFAVLDGELAEDELADAIATRTWRYAKRQRSWFGKDPRCEPEPPDDIRKRFTAPG
ncbi:MAG: tRNA (adenosine(37)-N6)-dimethylallyltransferase MiaA [Nitriliruptorales bacterium]|nr:tRNA (adenosine(37)-N6)-dimethylallyltransferase MiaA [Nitriliruptorales bacterium]